MRIKLIYALSLITIISCNSNNSNEIERKAREQDSLKAIQLSEGGVISIGKPYFNFDQLEHYHKDIPELVSAEINENKTRSFDDSLKYQIIEGKCPTNINDTVFISKLINYGYTKTFIESDKFKEINEIFREKKFYALMGIACIAIYRDILVFRNHGKICGIAKVCFKCGQHVIVGTESNTAEFGQAGDYNKLNLLLNN